MILVLVACNQVPEVDQVPTLAPEPAPTHTPPPTAILAPPLTLDKAAETVINALAAKDLATVAGYVHPGMGVRFTPYAYVEDSHQVFLAHELPGLDGSEQVFLWGAYDGTGDPIELTFDDYFERFVYSADFANPEQVAVNERIGHGNSLNNIEEFYPGSSFVEYHFSGFVEEYGGMDWASLRLVFIQQDGSWFLVGVVHDQWTI